MQKPRHGGKRNTCGHCDYVEVYYLERDTQIRESERVENMGESRPIITFKMFLVGLAGRRYYATV